MHRKRRVFAGRILAALLLASLLLSGVSCASGGQDTGTDGLQEAAGGLTPLDTEVLKSANVDGMKVIAENQRFCLCMDAETTDFAVVDKSSQKVFHSNPLRADGSIVVTDSDAQGAYQSSLVVSYNDKGQNEGEYDSFEDSASLGQAAFYTLENGVRIVYQLGENAEKDILPRALTVEEYRRIVDSLERSDKKTVEAGYMLMKTEEMTNGQPSDYIDKEYYLSQFTALKEQDLYVLRELRPTVRKRLKDLFIKIGYTYEQMVEQREKTGSAVGKSGLNIVVPLDLTIDEGGLHASVDASLIHVTDGYAVTKISLLAGLGATRSQDGFFIVPDGSGALIPLYNPEGLLYSQPVYGMDAALSTTAGYESASQVVMPYFALTTGDSTILGSVTEGEAMAAICAQPIGGTNPAARAFAQFTVTDTDRRAIDQTSQSVRELLTARGSEKGVFSVYYQFCERAYTYSETARLYQKTLVDAGVLPEQTDTERRLYLDLYGMVLKDTHFMGFPITEKTVLTSFEQAQTILDALYDKGIDGMRVRYLGMANGGMQNRLAKGYDIEACLGGQKGFAALQEHIAQRNIAIYPDAVINYIYQDGLLDGFSAGRDVTRRISGQSVAHTLMDLAENKETEELPCFPLTVAKIRESAASLLKPLEKQNIRTLSLSTIGGRLESNFNRRVYTTRSDTQKAYEEILAQLSGEGLGIMVETGHQYTLPYADAVVGLPSGNSGLTIESTGIPFVQIVLSGRMEYAMTAFNQSGNVQWERLRAIETGAMVYYRLMYADNMELKKTAYEGLSSMNYAIWLDQVADSYRYVEEALALTEGSAIKDHETLNGQVAVTTYGNGTRIYVNYGNEAFVTDEGLEVPAAGYAVA